VKSGAGFPISNPNAAAAKAVTIPSVSSVFMMN
jgi:hypothetical protein